MIPIGVALISRFASIFFLFGAFLIYTAVVLYRESDDESKWKEGRIVGKMRAHGISTFTIALVALALTDLVFSLGLNSSNLRSYKKSIHRHNSKCLCSHGNAPTLLLIASTLEALDFPLLKD